MELLEACIDDCRIVPKLRSQRNEELIEERIGAASGGAETPVGKRRQRKALKKKSDVLAAFGVAPEKKSSGEPALSKKKSASAALWQKGLKHALAQASATPAKVSPAQQGGSPSSTPKRGANRIRGSPPASSRADARRPSKEAVREAAGGGQAETAPAGDSGGRSRGEKQDGYEEVMATYCGTEENVFRRLSVADDGR